MSKNEQKTRFEQIPASLLYVMNDESIVTTVPARDTEQYAAWQRDRDE